MSLLVRTFFRLEGMFSKCSRQLTTSRSSLRIPRTYARTRQHLASGISSSASCRRLWKRSGMACVSPYPYRLPPPRVTIHVAFGWDLQNAVVTYRPKEPTLITHRLAGDLLQAKKHIEDKVKIVVNLKTQSSEPSQ
ncbi:hypothetical protein C8Q80DRAFT_1176636 [Daedaleopsis nitida]|nr:hypothetical protein C8Q80DRAFT_1176636 [Daedaleopsis nitida]